MVAAFGFGMAADYFGRTKTLIATILIYAVFTGFAAFAQEWWHLAIYRFLTALGIGGEWAALVDSWGAVTFKLEYLHADFGSIRATAKERFIFTDIATDGALSGPNLASMAGFCDLLPACKVIASGGVGNLQHIYEGFTKGKADAALAASIFHFKEYTIRQSKEYLRERGVPVRL